MVQSSSRHENFHDINNRRKDKIKTVPINTIILGFLGYTYPTSGSLLDDRSLITNAK